MAEKTEQPTSKKRKDSAKKGQTFKSKDLITTVVLLVGIFYLAYGMNFSSFIDFYSLVLLNGSKMGINDYLIGLMRIFFRLSLPFIALCTLVGMGLTLLQTGFVIATEALKVNFNALNPVNGIKKIFSMRTIKELVKAICFLMVFVATCYSLIHNDLRQALTIYQTDIAGLITCWIALTLKSVLVFIGCSLLVLIGDFITEYFLHSKDLKMDKHEVKQEYKENEGNPEIKGARKRAHQEILSGEEMAGIRNSEVVMANPTHIAMAIFFNPEVASLPFIALRCSNTKARAAIAYAEKIGVPVVRNISLARRLYYTYTQYSFISLNDEALLDVMDVLIWLRQVETAGINVIDTVDPAADSVLPENQPSPTD